MGWRYRKTVRVAPGVRVNVAKTGPSLSIGPRGASVNVSRGGLRLTLALLGTGLGYVVQRGWKRR